MVKKFFIANIDVFYLLSYFRTYLTRLKNMRILTKMIYNAAQGLRSCGIKFHEEDSPKVIAMRKRMQALDGVIEFKIEQYPDGSWSAESTNIDGIITGGRNTKEISSIIKDAIFTYFEIPAHLSNDKLLRTDNEPVTLIKRVYA